MKSWKFHKNHQYQGNENFNYCALNFKVASQTYLWKSFKCRLPLKVNDIFRYDEKRSRSEWIWYFTAFAQSRIRKRYVPLLANKTPESPFHWCSGRSWSTAPKASLSISKHFLSSLIYISKLQSYSRNWHLGYIWTLMFRIAIIAMLKYLPRTLLQKMRETSIASESSMASAYFRMSLRMVAD